MRVTLQPSGAVLEIRPAERILDGARRLGYECPQSCRNGNCHVCGALLVEGRVRQAGDVCDHGEIFTCIAEPLEDCVVLWDGVLAPGELPVRRLACQVTGCVDVGGDVWRVSLRAPAGKPPRYHAGQYLMIERENGDKSAFSLASAPHSGRDLQLHVLVRENSAKALLEQLQRNPNVHVEMPFGDTHLSELPDGPLVLIAAGTGMAQMHSLIEHCRAEGFKHPVHLYWGVRRPDDFYEIEHWDEWKKLPNLFLHKVVSDLCGWEGRCGMLHEAVCEDISDLSGVYVYASGSPAMIYATLDALVEAGMDAHQMRADVFAYAPRA
ncbi:MULTISPECIES: CDP-6-deoxy-delta-3,4-glucoseen reductase [unclassified Pseudomonas]|uniref:CDP-6-deoxy-delta-3,4-glucoseen reductase n=1 Tax=unclassified Pseudomonas TaxID=196821 RepID=UPI00119C591A|nr:MULTISPECIES: CDP-6-deoxy-delta-3,4-glucoseen reductase [unclassified Pseudomonas]TWC13236.1 CDP-4-dehydro-6-deoxyglucose reductase [Pseudomonas sp. SJZ074]TWC17448.1 CDP-4-dehydro-6-deoxyglucose reductase [Pseudomonas sp. SJZ075]TWC31661.1 CDP-4-dehydro-6-deoxyglucose reductase [Pseudomonas sp. SJZ085]TWC33795.1 CDP-4-dehydro-6-deoxyglucose reductase [Pseudomonas sp. SJZ078]TWC54747.1 CDP-4-dehydro-6-deoxyglucose reductase [Pseudomonas sp. SJZ124]